MQTNSGGGHRSLPTPGPFSRNPSSARGVGGSVPARKLISAASHFDECERATFTVCMCVEREVVKGGGLGFGKRNQALWGFPAEASLVRTVSNSVITLTLCLFSSVGK